MRTHLTAMFVSAGLAVSALAGVASAAPAAVSGTIDVNSTAGRSAPLVFGGNVSFQASVNGRLDSKGYTYITAMCQQGGKVVYQWSSRDLGFTFPLVDQDGQGLEWDGSRATCAGYLIYRVDRKNGDLIQTLDSVPFDVG